ncbi:ESX-1 secretion-associated protein EspK-like [Pan troglodytes]|uniref:ESX-1 secretion-associated protein EspK-like n=1 Tax=Pan troglodytes TaxID=9598 RepID=UPI000512001D|nr:ESX-1 secretion-associated protein EspK-like [Pan troglodytes]
MEPAEPPGTPASWSLQDLPTPTPHYLQASHSPSPSPTEGTRPITPSRPGPSRYRDKEAPRQPASVAAGHWCSSGDAENHSQPERHPDTKTSCQPQTQVSPGETGGPPAFTARTHKRTDRPTHGPGDLDTR